MTYGVIILRKLHRESLHHWLTKVAVKKADRLVEKPALEPSVTFEMVAGVDELLAPATWPFTDALFTKLREHIEALWIKVMVDIKEVSKEVTNLGN
ncbi:hypothetical protein NDU88_004501 [Pleurodeles waltl]|uniref:Uncharacterized protein n=1 Tax=Pleurodeles waltl TaxID=8319 RepID=A0AAV7N365_PLEWA|nr:hypothetical protein NDU88_004501 [Pleurodeles waltl]